MTADPSSAANPAVGEPFRTSAFRTPRTASRAGHGCWAKRNRSSQAVIDHPGPEGASRSEQLREEAAGRFSLRGGRSSPKAIIIGAKQERLYRGAAVR